MVEHETPAYRTSCACQTLGQSTNSELKTINPTHRPPASIALEQNRTDETALEFQTEPQTATTPTRPILRASHPLVSPKRSILTSLFNHRCESFHPCSRTWCSTVSRFYLDMYSDTSFPCANENLLGVAVNVPTHNTTTHCAINARRGAHVDATSPRRD